jgi:hypothetical protein
VVSFTPRPLYPQGKSPWYPLDRRLGEPQNRSGRGSEEKNSQPLPGIEPYNPDRPVGSPALSELSRLLISDCMGVIYERHLILDFRLVYIVISFQLILHDEYELEPCLAASIFTTLNTAASRSSKTLVSYHMYTLCVITHRTTTLKQASIILLRASITTTEDVFIKFQECGRTVLMEKSAGNT